MVRDAEISGQINKARLIAGELWELLREDAAHRLGLADAYPQALDKVWSPEFYRKCQLAERLYAVLEEISLLEAATGVNESRGMPDQVPLKPGKVVPHTAGHSGRRFRV